VNRSLRVSFVAGLLALLSSIYAAPVGAGSFVGTQTAPTEWTYTLTYDPYDNYAVCPSPGNIATITVTGLSGVARATAPTSTDMYTGIALINLQWIPQVASDGTSVTWTHVGPGTGNPNIAKHVFGFKIFTEAPSVSGEVNVVSGGFSLDVSRTGPCPVTPGYDRDFAGTTAGPVAPDVNQQLAHLATLVSGLGPGKSLLHQVTNARTEWARKHVSETCSILAAFINHVRAQSGKTIPLDMATNLSRAADRIRTELRC